MDPTATLRLIDLLLKRPQNGYAEDLSDHCTDLYRWLKNGGFEPDWYKYPAAARHFRLAFLGRGYQPCLRARLVSTDQLRQLEELLGWANASDSDDSQRPAQYASQHGSLYGFFAQAVAEIVWRECSITWEELGCPNYGGSSSRYADLLDQIFRYEQELYKQ